MGPFELLDNAWLIWRTSRKWSWSLCWQPGGFCCVKTSWEWELLVLQIPWLKSKFIKATQTLIFSFINLSSWTMSILFFLDISLKSSPKHNHRLYLVPPSWYCDNLYLRSAHICHFTVTDEKHSFHKHTRTKAHAYHLTQFLHLLVSNPLYELYQISL